MVTKQVMSDRTNGKLTAYSTVIGSLVLPIVVWLLIDVAAIKGNRFTSGDARDMQRQIADIWRVIHLLPPDDFEAKVDKIIADLHKLELRVVKLEGK